MAIGPRVRYVPPMTVVPRRTHRMSPATDDSPIPGDGDPPRELTAGEIRALRGLLRRERGEIHAAAIAGGPTEVLCARLNALEQKERFLARAERLQRDRRSGAVRGLLGSIGL
jgi:hypothetical protein